MKNWAELSCCRWFDAAALIRTPSSETWASPNSAPPQSPIFLLIEHSTAQTHSRWQWKNSAPVMFANQMPWTTRWRESVTHKHSNRIGQNRYRKWWCVGTGLQNKSLRLSNVLTTSASLFFHWDRYCFTIHPHPPLITSVNMNMKHST